MRCINCDRCEEECHVLMPAKRDNPVAPALPPPQAFAIASGTVSADTVIPTASATAPAAASSAAAPPVTASSAAPQQAGTGVAGGPCEGPGSNCVGDVTHWNGGLGACGRNIATGSDLQIALPVGLMGSQSNNNPYCGRSVTIKNPSGGTVAAKVGDKCMVRKF